MADRGMQCAKCSTWVTGMGEKTSRMPWHSDPKVKTIGNQCGGVGRRPKATRGFEYPPETE